MIAKLVTGTGAFLAKGLKTVVPALGITSLELQKILVSAMTLFAVYVIHTDAQLVTQLAAALPIEQNLIFLFLLAANVIKVSFQTALSALIQPAHGVPTDKIAAILNSPPMTL